MTGWPEPVRCVPIWAPRPGSARPSPCWPRDGAGPRRGTRSWSAGSSRRTAPGPACWRTASTCCRRGASPTGARSSPTSTCPRRSLPAPTWSWWTSWPTPPRTGPGSGGKTWPRCWPPGWTSSPRPTSRTCARSATTRPGSPGSGPRRACPMSSSGQARSCWWTCRRRRCGPGSPPARCIRRLRWAGRSRITSGSRTWRHSASWPRPGWRAPPRPSARTCSSAAGWPNPRRQRWSSRATRALAGVRRSSTAPPNWPGPTTPGSWSCTSRSATA
jgi:hypothetical protein